MSDKLDDRGAGFYDAELARPERPSKAALVTGWVMVALPALFLLVGSVTAMSRSPQVVEGTARLGYTASMLPVLAGLEFSCAVLLLIPRTAVLGALLVTAYCGGAVARHVRLGQAQWVAPVVVALVVWVGLLLRRPRAAAGDDGGVWRVGLGSVAVGKKANRLLRLRLHSGYHPGQQAVRGPRPSAERNPWYAVKLAHEWAHPRLSR